jgi:hypothetical protein
MRWFDGLTTEEAAEFILISRDLGLTPEQAWEGAQRELGARTPREALQDVTVGRSRLRQLAFFDLSDIVRDVVGAVFGTGARRGRSAAAEVKALERRLRALNGKPLRYKYDPLTGRLRRR